MYAREHPQTTHMHVSHTCTQVFLNTWFYTYKACGAHTGDVHTGLAGCYRRECSLWYGWDVETPLCSQEETRAWSLVLSAGYRYVRTSGFVPSHRLLTSVWVCCGATELLTLLCIQLCLMLILHSCFHVHTCAHQQCPEQVGSRLFLKGWHCKAWSLSDPPACCVTTQRWEGMSDLLMNCGAPKIHKELWTVWKFESGQEEAVWAEPLQVQTHKETLCILQVHHVVEMVWGGSLQTVNEVQCFQVKTDCPYRYYTK